MKIDLKKAKSLLAKSSRTYDQEAMLWDFVTCAISNDPGHFRQDIEPLVRKAKSPLIARCGNPNAVKKALEYTPLVKIAYSTRRLSTLQTLAERDQLSHIIDLHLLSTSLADFNIETLTLNAGLCNLRSLHIGGCKLKGGLIALSGAEHFHGLESLFLEHNQLTAEGLSAFAGSGLASSLKRLRIQREKLAPEAVGALAASANLGVLEALELRLCQLKPDGARAFGVEGAFSSLTSLYLTANKLKTDGLRALLDAPFVENLEQLDLFNNKLKDDATEVLASEPRLAKLEKIWLGDNHFTDEGWARLEASETFTARVIKKYPDPHLV